MYSEVQLYYLNQLGIRPWVKKNDAAVILYVVIAPDLSPKAQSLVRQIMAYISLPDHEFCIQSGIRNGENPKIILTLGASPGEKYHSPCPILTGFHPDYLLKNPSEKRKLFHILNHLRRLLDDLR